MSNEIKNGLENTDERYMTNDGLIFTTREEYLDYMEGLRN